MNNNELFTIYITMMSQERGLDQWTSDWFW